MFIIPTDFLKCPDIHSVALFENSQIIFGDNCSASMTKMSVAHNNTAEMLKDVCKQLVRRCNRYAAGLFARQSNEILRRSQQDAM